MKYHIPHKKNSSITTQVVCAVLFVLFAFSWLYWFQADLLAVAQHTLSGGVTRYDRTVGAVLITAVLVLVQRVVVAVTRLFGRTHALTYGPSMMALALMGDMSVGSDHQLSFASCRWAVLVALVMWVGLVWMAKKVLPFGAGKEQSGLFSRRVWINALLMVAMMVAVAAVSNTHAVLHFRAHAEVALSKGDTAEALRVGNRSHETDESLTMLRVYALSRSGQLGDRLFSYPLKGTGSDIVPTGDSRSRLLLLSADSLWRHLGARPKSGMGTRRYLQALEGDTMGTRAVADYVLCAALIDRDLDAFVGALSRFGLLGDSTADALPRHYREALILYTHQRSHPVTVYHHAVMDEDWDNLQELEQRHADAPGRKTAVRERYAGSYWYYYFYNK